MCIEDVAFARRTYTESHVTDSSNSVQLPANPQRLAVVITINGTDDLTCDVYTGVGLSSGRHIASLRTFDQGTAEGTIGPANVCFNYRDHLSIVTAPMYIAGVEGEVGVTEVLMDEDLAREVAEYLYAKRSKYARR